MNYFSWTEEAVMNMSYEKFTMYLATIPDYSPDKDGEADDDAADDRPRNAQGVITGSFNLFDFDERL